MQDRVEAGVLVQPKGRADPHGDLELEAHAVGAEHDPGGLLVDNLALNVVVHGELLAAQGHAQLVQLGADLVERGLAEVRTGEELRLTA